MEASHVLASLAAAGIELRSDGGNLRARPRERITDEHRAMIRANKSELIRFLTTAEREEIEEAIGERAAIQEYDGGLSRTEAERQANAAMRVYQYRVTDKPKSWLILIAPNCDLAKARRSLEWRFGERLIEVKGCSCAYH